MSKSAQSFTPKKSDKEKNRLHIKVDPFKQERPELLRAQQMNKPMVHKSKKDKQRGRNARKGRYRNQIDRQIDIDIDRMY